MTFPAAYSAQQDARLTPVDRAVYGYLMTVLDFTQARRVRVELECDRAAVSENTFAKALRRLSEFGYVLEHDRDARGVRQLTLIWSVNREDIRTADKPAD